MEEVTKLCSNLTAMVIIIVQNACEIGGLHHESLDTSQMITDLTEFLLHV